MKDFSRVTRDMPCPVCKKSDWCLIANDGQSVICARIKSKKKCGEAGWLYKDDSFDELSPIIKKTVHSKKDPKKIQEIYNRLDFSYGAIKYLASEFNIGWEVLRSMGVGYADGVWYTPMYNENFEIIGLKKRNKAGKKWCARGSQLGVYLQSGLVARRSVYICEGESDTASMISQGYRAIGRASATTCGRILCQLLNHTRDVTIISDFDANGIGYRSSCELAKNIKNPHCTVYIAMHRKHKDIRAWINSGEFTKEKLEKLRKEYK